jgi:hypothetical protein
VSSDGKVSCDEAYDFESSETVALPRISFAAATRVAASAASSPRVRATARFTSGSSRKVRVVERRARSPGACSFER